MLRRLSSPNERPLGRGDLFQFSEHPDWDPEYRNKIWIAEYTQPLRRTTLALGTGALSDGVVAAGSTVDPIDLQTQVQPYDKASFFQCRWRIPRNSMRWYIRYPAGQIRGALEQPGFQSITPTDPDTGLMSYYTYEDSPREAPLMEMWWIWNMFPRLLCYNPGPDHAKAIVDLDINAIRGRPATQEDLQNFVDHGGDMSKILLLTSAKGVVY